MATSNTHSLKMKPFRFDELGTIRDSERKPVDKNLERLSWLMDDLFRVPVLGWRFGLDALVGLIPGFGDTTTSLVSFYILVSAVRHRVPKITLLRMGFNIAIDYVMGSLPVVGDLADAWWKSNHMNIDLLRKHATVAGEEERSARMSDWIFVSGIIIGLIALALASAVVSFYLLTKLFTGLAG